MVGLLFPSIGGVGVDVAGSVEAEQCERVTWEGEQVNVSDVEALLGATHKRGVQGVRDRALLHVLHRTGIRVGELCALRVGSVGFDAAGDPDRIVVRRLKKRGKPVEDSLALHWRASTALREWLGVHPVGDDAAPLFCGVKVGLVGDPMSVRSVQKLLAGLGGRAGVEGVHPHAFRHLLLTELARETGDPFIVRDVAGHAKLDTALRYVRGVRSDSALTDRD